MKALYDEISDVLQGVFYCIVKKYEYQFYSPNIPQDVGKRMTDFLYNLRYTHHLLSDYKITLEIIPPKIPGYPRTAQYKIWMYAGFWTNETKTVTIEWEIT